MTFMSNEEHDLSTDMVRVGRTIPGGPVGDIWCSLATIAQIGEEEVRRNVRDIFRAAYAQQRTGTE
jgi:hypothetical protein